MAKVMSPNSSSNEYAGAEYALQLMNYRKSWSAKQVIWFGEYVYKRYSKFKDVSKNEFGQGFRNMCYNVAMSKK